MPSKRARTAPPPPSVLPAPNDLGALVEALSTAAQDVVQARTGLQEVLAAAKKQLSADASKFKTDLQRAVDGAVQKLERLEERASAVRGKLADELEAFEAKRSLLEAALDELEQARAERETWEAEAMAALARAQARIGALEEDNRRLSDAQRALEERLDALEKKKRFGIF